MRRFLSALVLLLPLGAALSAYADPLFDFTITGDEHVFEFSTPNPAPVYDHPHVVFAGFGGPGSVDGASGYAFGVSAAGSPFNNENFFLFVDPTPPGLALQYFLAGPTILTLVSVVPVTYNPIYPCCGYQNLLTFAIVPGDYSFVLISLDGTFIPYRVDIAQESGTAVTPEPATWMLLGTGAAGLLGRWKRRGAH